MRIVLRVIFCLLGCALVSGCTSSGDFGTFIVAEVVKHGGHTITNAALPALAARWTVERDNLGFQMHLTDAPFTNIDAIMHQAFGVPRISVETNLTGQPHRVWGSAEIGVALQLIGRTNGAEVICIRRMGRPGEMFESRQQK